MFGTQSEGSQAMCSLMSNAGHDALFPGFHQQLYGREPLAAAECVRRKKREADALCPRQLHTLFADVLPTRGCPTFGAYLSSMFD